MPRTKVGEAPLDRPSDGHCRQDLGSWPGREALHLIVTTAGPWIAFILAIVALVVLDLGVFHRRPRVVAVREAIFWTGVWIALAVLFNVFLYVWKGDRPALEFATGYLIEKALSVDNLFVFLVIFQTFEVPLLHQHRVLFWGILGALVLRGAMIGIGAALVTRFVWILDLFGVFLVWTGLKMLRGDDGDDAPDPKRNWVIRLFNRFVPSTPEFRGQHFFVKVDGRRLATPMLLVLAIVETSDIAFATDSIPAIFAITRDPFVVYTSNIFAILGLRSLYFLLATIMPMFAYLPTGVSLVLIFIGAKMLLAHWIEIPVVTSLAVVFGVLTMAIVASVAVGPRPPREDQPAPPGS